VLLNSEADMTHYQSMRSLWH